MLLFTSCVLVTTSKALVTRSDALVPSSVLAPYFAWHPHNSQLVLLFLFNWVVLVLRVLELRMEDSIMYCSLCDYSDYTLSSRAHILIHDMCQGSPVQSDGLSKSSSMGGSYL